MYWFGLYVKYKENDAIEKMGNILNFWVREEARHKSVSTYILT